MSPFISELVLAIGIILLAWLVSYVVMWLVGLLRRQVVARTATIFDDVFVEAAAFPLRAAIVVGGIELALQQMTMIIPLSWEGPLNRIFFALYYLLIYIFLYRLIGGGVIWYSREVAHRTETELDDKFLGLFRHMGLIALTAIVFIIVLSRFGIEVSALVTTLGIGSLAVAFGGAGGA